MPKVTYIRPYVTHYQKDIIDSDVRFTVCEAATKTGKTASHIIWLFEQALNLKAGQWVWWVAPVYPQAKIAYNRMKDWISPKGSYTANETSLYIKLYNGAMIGFKSAEKPDNLYGEDVYAAVFDEFTRAREESWYALRSTLTATGGKCKMIGNTKGKKNWGYKLGIKAKHGEANYKYFKITAWDAVDAIPDAKANNVVLGITKDEVEQAQRDLPEVIFRELYLAEASDDGSNPFGIQAIQDCIKPISTLPVASYGVDLAKHRDWTVIVGLDINGDVCYFDRFQKDWAQTTDTLVRLIGRSAAHIDSTGVGDPIVEQITRTCPLVKGVNYAAGVKTKQQLMEGLAYAISHRKISILAGIMQDEMEAFEFEYSNGRVKYSTLGTDDAVNALALAVDCTLHKIEAVIEWA